jgi:hypothetical protein
MSIIMNATVEMAQNPDLSFYRSQPSLRRLALQVKPPIAVEDVVVTASFLAETRDLNQAERNTVDDLSIGQVEEWALVATTQALWK